MVKISCDECQRKIDDYISNTLDDAELENFFFHVKDCPICMEELSINYSVITALNQLNHNMELSEDYDKEIQDQIDNFVNNKKKQNIIFALAASILLFTAIFVGILGSIVLYNKPIVYSNDSEATEINIDIDVNAKQFDYVDIMIDKYHEEIVKYLHSRDNNE